MTLPLTVATVHASADGAHSTAGRGPWAAVLLVASLVGSGPACNVQCTGPGCESSWPAARLDVVRGLPETRESAVRDVAAGTWTGALEEGAVWTPVAVRSQLAIGQQEASRVVLVADRADSGKVEPLSSWTADPGTSFGASLAVVEDVEGSQAFDLWVGAPASDFWKGAVHVFRAAQSDGAVGLEAADLTLTGGTAGDQLGMGVVACPDLTGDRLPEVLVTAPWFASPPGTDLVVPPLAGGAFLLRSQDLVGVSGRVAVWEVATTWYGATAGEGAGRAVSCDRDLDGDGAPDVVVGAPWAGGGRGKVYFLGGGDLPSGRLDQVATATLEGAGGGDLLGSALVGLTVGVQTALAIGAPGVDGGRGQVAVYPGPELDAQVPRRLLQFDASTRRSTADHFGRTLVVGDLDGDGSDDLVVGAPDVHGPDRNDFDSGSLWIWTGATSATWSTRPGADDADRELTGAHPFERVGARLVAEDLDGDGVDDLLVPSRAPDPTETR